MRNEKKISIPKKEMVAEHVHLLSVLKHPTKKKLLSEYVKQSKELKEYKHEREY